MYHRGQVKYLMELNKAYNAESENNKEATVNINKLINAKEVIKKDSIVHIGELANQKREK